MPFQFPSGENLDLIQSQTIKTMALFAISKPRLCINNGCDILKFSHILLFLSKYKYNSLIIISYTYQFKAFTQKIIIKQNITILILRAEFITKQSMLLLAIHSNLLAGITFKKKLITIYFEIYCENRALRLPRA